MLLGAVQRIEIRYDEKREKQKEEEKVNKNRKMQDRKQSSYVRKFLLLERLHPMRRRMPTRSTCRGTNAR